MQRATSARFFHRSSKRLTLSVETCSGVVEILPPHAAHPAYTNYWHLAATLSLCYHIVRAAAKPTQICLAVAFAFPRTRRPRHVWSLAPVTVQVARAAHAAQKQPCFRVSISLTRVHSEWARFG